MHEALIFDLGKVVFDLSFDRVFQSWAKASNEPADALKAKFRFDEVFDQFEKDAITPHEFRGEVSKRLGLTLTDQAFDAGWGALYLDPYPGVDHLLAQLQQRYRLVALTNTNRIHSAVWQLKYADALQPFEQVFSSHELKARKPEAEAYHRVLDYLQVKPAHAVFLDDNLDNIKGATQPGLNTIWVTSYDQMAAELQTLG